MRKRVYIIDILGFLWKMPKLFELSDATGIIYRILNTLESPFSHLFLNLTIFLFVITGLTALFIFIFLN